MRQMAAISRPEARRAPSGPPPRQAALFQEDNREIRLPISGAVDMGGIGVPLKRPMGEIALDFSGPQPEPIAVSRGPNGVEIQRFGKSHPPEASPPNATNRGRGAPGIRGVFGKPQKLRGARGSLLRGSFLATEPEIRREDQRHRILFRDHIRNQKRPFRTGVLNSASITFYDSRKSRGLQITPSLW